MYAVFLTVDIKPGRFDEATKGLETFVVPATAASREFVSGVWWNSADESTGYGLVVFEDETAAKTFADQIAEPEEAPVSIRSVEVRPVTAIRTGPPRRP
jgi:hypothetical protein